MHVTLKKYKCQVHFIYYLQKNNHSSRFDDTIWMQNMSAWWHSMYAKTVLQGYI